MNNADKSFCFALIFFLSAVLPSACLAWSGKVISVPDGDTIKVVHAGKEEKIGLYGIDAPEKKQNFSQEAREYLSSFVAGQIVEVERKGTDKYGRTTGLVTVGGENVNELMVINGYAWVYQQYCKEPYCANWVKMEDAARQGKKGLWNDAHVMPPWEFRNVKKQNIRKTTKKQTVATEVSN